MNYQDRMKYLRNLKTAIINHESDIKQALFLDLGKSSQESYLTEIGIVLSEISLFMKKLKKWMKPKKVKGTIVSFPSKSYIYPEKYGRVLIIGPWNYPFQLIMNPLIGAIGAGNKVVLKPSEFSVETAKIIIKIIQEVFNEDVVKVISGDANVSQKLLDEYFDYIFFTGSKKVGQIVLEKASKHLTPVTLELGGKSPAIIMDKKNLKLTAKSVAFGKLVNAGQTCIAPDYVLIHKPLKDAFIKHYIEAVKSFYGEDPLNNSDYPKIIHDKHHQRLLSLMTENEIIYGGNYSKDKIEPTIILPKENSPIMEEEIFGPLLPVVTIDKVEDCHAYIIEKPLALYLFTDNKQIRSYVLNNVSAGGITVNDTLMHFSNHNLGFGGVGASGMGKYHGKHSFDTFTHYKPVLLKSNMLDVSAKYLPSSTKKERFIKRILK